MTRAGAFTVDRRRRTQPAYWRLNPASRLTTSTLVRPDLEADAQRAIATQDPGALLMTVAEAVEGGHHRTAGLVARASLDQNTRLLPDIGAARLHALAIAGGVAVHTGCVADLATVADQLRDSALMHEIGFGLTSARRDSGTLASSLADAQARCDRLADHLTAVARGDRVQLARVIQQLGFFGLLSLARALAGLCKFASGASGLDVAVAAQVRHRVSSARGLQAQLEIIRRAPGNVAARTSACACLVDLGLYEDALDQLAVALLAPDRFSGNAGRRALRAAGYSGLSEVADQLAAEMAHRHASEQTPRALRLATDILVGIERRAHAELAMVGLAKATGAAFTFQRRLEYDRVTVHGAGR